MATNYVRIIRITEMLQEVINNIFSSNIWKNFDTLASLWLKEGN